MAKVIIQNNSTRVIILGARSFSKDGEGAAVSTRVPLKPGLTTVEADKWDRVKNVPMCKKGLDDKTLIVSDTVSTEQEEEERAVQDAVRQAIQENQSKQKAAKDKADSVANLKRRKEQLVRERDEAAKADEALEKLSAEEAAVMAELAELGDGNGTTESSPGDSTGSAVS